MSTRRVLFISRCPAWPLTLGDRLIVYHLARELQARGTAIDLLAHYPHASELAVEQGYLAHYERFFASVSLIPEPARPARSLLWRALAHGQRFPRQAAGAWSSAMWAAIRAQLTRQTYDAIHLFGGVQVYEYFHALAGQPAVITPYESYTLYLQRAFSASHRPADWLRGQIARHYERFMFAPYDAVVVLAEADRALLQRLNPRLPLTVIPNGVVLPAAPTAVRSPATLIFVGNYEYAPNVEAAHLLAEIILPEVSKRCAAARLILVGQAPPHSIRALAGPHVTVTGYVPDITPYLQEAAVFVSPLRVGAGLKNKILEALAHGLPVVATPVSVDGIAVQHEHSALVGDVHELATLTTRLLADEALQTRLSDSGRALVEQRYSWGAVAEAYLRLYAAPGRRAPHR
jgi:glycosyltransferase involved in cell wall biosynthesis